MGAYSVGVVLDRTLPKSLRLLKRGSFQYLGKKGKRFHSQIMTLQVLDVSGDGRFGLTVSKKIGNAPTRNLIKRRLRHIVSMHKGMLKNRHIVFQAKSGIAELGFDALKTEVERLLDKVHQQSEKGRR